MKAAIPIYNNVVANVFDFAQRLAVIEIDEGKQISRFETVIEGQSGLQRANQLKALGVNTLICGAISAPLANIVQSLSIQLLPNITGVIDDVLAAFIDGQLISAEFMMPGCFRGRHSRRGLGRGRRGCRWASANNMNFNV
jgi:predicted Fe-Mo cluster-binding NifX family protein